MNKGLLVAGIIMVLALAGAGAVIISDSVSVEETYTGGVALLCTPGDPNCEPPNGDDNQCTPPDC